MRTLVSIGALLSVACSSALQESSRASAASPIEVVAIPDASGEHFALWLRNRTGAPVTLDNELFIDERALMGWTELTSHRVLVNGDWGDHGNPETITLAPNDIRTLAWDGTFGAPHSCLVFDAPSGVYRFSVHEHERPMRFTSDPFEIRSSR